MSKYLTFFFILPFLSIGQGSGKVWIEYGVKKKLTKDLECGLEMTNRFGSSGLETFFPQASLKYSVTKWFKPSIDYRAIFDKNDFGNYSFSNRINLNATFKHTIDRFSFGGRFRYQYAFAHLRSTSDYDVEFDQAIRLKPEVSYDLNNSFLTPVASIECFYDPNYGPLGQRFSKFRMFLGTEFELDGPHDISVGYIFDRQINLPDPKTKHILSVSYTFELGADKN